MLFCPDTLTVDEVPQHGSPDPARETGPSSLLGIDLHLEGARYGANDQPAVHGNVHGNSTQHGQDPGGNQRARLAVEVFCYRARKYLGAYLAVLGVAEAVVFSGGIGENSPLIREKICGEMAWCGLLLDETQNDSIIGAEGRISRADARIHAYVIPSDEEVIIARETAILVQ